MHEGKLAIRAAKKKKKSIANIEKTNIFKQISISNGEEATKFSRCKQKKKSNQICKGKRMSISDTTEKMDIVCPQARGNQFNKEIIIEILFKIPVRSTLRFKCVSKSWKELILNPSFKMKHLNHAKNDQNSHKLLINKKCLDKDDVFNLYCSTLSSVQVVEDEQKLDWPSNCNPEDSVLYCSCDGLVLLAIYNGSCLLPHPKSRPKYCVCGMGYDATTDDYKILAIEHDCGMYSLAFVHGAFHWVGLSSHCYTVISFNISNEVYGEIPLLEQMCNVYEARFIEHGVSVLGGCFALVLHIIIHGGHIQVVGDERLGCDSDFFYSAKPIYMYADGEVLLRCNYFGVLSSVYRTSRESFELLPQCHTFKQGMVSLISPKSLI
ncbi:hypothetical protein R3W88_028480 [Solanum pinnatisectum]|uniref:F-box domain-containing protein n=1 Tax=Solanum pinnatisectum TaxID=50273 RepID=A0AAV9K4R9_9SOLN|nr:hypothetical protein R3W88_028480 [Solanum pinnatisectum]